MSLPNIMQVPMECESCKKRCSLGDAIPCAGGGSRYGCPQPDCGGFLLQIPIADTGTIYDLWPYDGR